VFGIFNWFSLEGPIMNAIYRIISQLENIGYGNLSVGLSEFNSGMFATVVQIAQMVVTPIALSLLTLFLMLELIEILKKAAGSGGVTMEAMIPFIFKFVISYALVNGAVGLLTGIFNITLSIINNITLSIGLNSDFLDLEATRYYVSETGFAEQLDLFVVVFLVSVIVMLGSVIINIKITMRMIEIYVFISLAPLPLSTLGSSEASLMGKSFLKSFTAVCVQGIVMLVYLSMASGMFATIGTWTADGSYIGSIWGIAGFMILLVFAIQASETTAKKIIGVM